MKYSVRWDEEALADLKALGKIEALRIVKKVESYLSKDPLNLGKPLKGNMSSLYRYRIGDYRVIYEVIDDVLMIVAVRVGHRKNVYDN